MKVIGGIFALGSIGLMAYASYRIINDWASTGIISNIDIFVVSATCGFFAILLTTESKKSQKLLGDN